MKGGARGSTQWPGRQIRYGRVLVILELLREKGKECRELSSNTQHCAGERLHSDVDIWWQHSRKQTRHPIKFHSM